MKKIIVLSTIANLLIIGNPNGYAQNVGVSAFGLVPNASALLDVDAAGMTPKKGMLIPRVILTSTTDVTTITSPANSLMVYNTGTGMVGGNGEGYYFYNTTAVKWIYVTSPDNGSGTTGQVLASRGTGNPPQWQSISTGGQGGKGTALGSAMVTSYMDSVGLFTPHGNNCAGTEEFVPLFTGATVGFCIDKDDQATQVWQVAMDACLSVGKRLPEAFEWQRACDYGTAAIIDMTNNNEWAGNFPMPLYNGTTGTSVVAVFGNGSCSLASYARVGDGTGARGTNAFRCVH